MSDPVQDQQPRKRSRREKVRESIARVQVSEGGFGGSFWYLYPDATMETHDGVFQLTHEVTATVDNDVKRQFAPAKMLAIGIFGVTKKRGAIYITVESETFHSFGTVTRNNEKGARKFAAEVNKAARQIPPPPAPAVPAEGPIDAADQIRKLAALKDEGLITSDEFEAKKRQILGL